VSVSRMKTASGGSKFTLRPVSRARGLDMPDNAIQMSDIPVSKSTAVTPGITVVPSDGDDWVGGGK